MLAVRESAIYHNCRWVVNVDSNAHDWYKGLYLGVAGLTGTIFEAKAGCPRGQDDGRRKPMELTLPLLNTATGAWKSKQW